MITINILWNESACEMICRIQLQSGYTIINNIFFFKKRH